MVGARSLVQAGGAAMLAIIGGLAIAADRPLQPAPSPDPVKTLGLVRNFDEEFGGKAVDYHRWVPDDPHTAVTEHTLDSNGERQLYVGPHYLDLGIEPLTVHDGMLTITARPLTSAERVVVRANVDALPPAQRHPALADLAYSSGRLVNRGKFSQLYGYFEARLRFSPGRGIWPAFWLLPADGSWPPEIDVIEALGHEPNKIYSTVHSGKGKPQDGIVASLTPNEDGFHRYGVLWGPTSVDYYIDGVKTGSVPTPADAHKPMYIILNLAIGGYWPGYPDASTHFPATMDVDYVRSWRFPDGGPRPAGG